MNSKTGLTLIAQRYNTVRLESVQCTLRPKTSLELYLGYITLLMKLKDVYYNKYLLYLFGHWGGENGIPWGTHHHARLSIRSSVHTYMRQ